MKTIILTIFGFLFLGLGAIGLLIPVWPTTPFVLISIACFSSSPHIKTRIMSISFFREHFENYEQRKGLSRKTLLISLCWLWGMLILSMFLLRELWITLFLIFIGTSVTFHLLWMSKERKKNRNDNKKA